MRLKYWIVLGCGLVALARADVAKVAPSPDELAPTLPADTLESREQLLKDYLENLEKRLATLQHRHQQTQQELQTQQRSFSMNFLQTLMAFYDAPSQLMMAHLKPKDHIHKIATSSALLQKNSQTLRQISKQEKNVADHLEKVKSEKTRCEVVLKALQQEQEQGQGFEERPVSPSFEWPVEGKQTQNPIETASSRTFFIRTDFLASVMCPASGQVTFCGPFKGKKQVLMVDHGKQYYSILSGFDKATVVPGDCLFQGETIAIMPGYGEKKPILTFELLAPGGTRIRLPAQS